MGKLVKWFLSPPDSAPAAVILVRLVVGGVFLGEGVLKFLYPTTLGAGRFVKIGLPAPEATAAFVGVVEIIFGAFLLLGLLTRLSTIPLMIDMCVAIATTKVPLLFGAGPLPVGNEPKIGTWAMFHEARLDFAMLLGCAFLLILGGGPYALDALLTRLRRSQSFAAGGASVHAPAAASVRTGLSAA